MGKKSNNIDLHLNQNKGWFSSWFLNLKEYSKILHKDILIYNYLYSFFNNKKFGILELLSMRIYRTNNIVIMDLSLSGIKNLNKDVTLKTFFSLLFYNLLYIILQNNNLFFVGIEKIALNKITNKASYIAYKICKLIESGVRFRSKVIKLFLKQIKKRCYGVYVICKGRINNVDMARTDRLFIGSVPLQSVRSYIDYSIMTANTRKGLQSIKVWVNN